MIKLTLEELKTLISRMEINEKHSTKQPYVNVKIAKHPNGREYLEFEQPSYYGDANSTYYRYDGVQPKDVTP
ncbi:MAG: hypothetical protein ACERKO_09480 [Acetanaerobacterium sp.]